jgi:hypothetical protein
MRRSIILLKLCCLFVTSAAVADDAAVDALAEARRLQLAFRQGNLQVVEPLVTGLERAVAQTPGNVDLWQALGNAYMSQQGALYQSQPDPKVLIAVGAGPGPEECFAPGKSRHGGCDGRPAQERCSSAGCGG